MNQEKPVQAMREKYWSELDEGEKAERMRQVIHGLQRTVRHLEDSVRTLLNHKHSAVDGSIVVPLAPRHMGFGEMPSTTDDDVYF